MSVEFWKSIFDWATVILIALTVFTGAGALITGDIIGKRQESRLRQFDKELTEAKKELGEQQERAANADARVAGLEQDAANAKTEMAKQQTRAATAERSLLELQERVKIRHLSPAQRKKLVDFLTAPAAAAVPKGPILVTRLLFDESSRPLSEEIKSALAEAGWNSPEVGKQYGGDATTPIGLVLQIHDGKARPAHFEFLHKAFLQAGLDPTLGQNANIPEDTVVVLVGIKP